MHVYRNIASRIWEQRLKACGPLALVLLINLFVLRLESSQWEILTQHQAFVASARAFVCAGSVVLLVIQVLAFWWEGTPTWQGNSEPATRSQSNAPAEKQCAASRG